VQSIARHSKKVISESVLQIQFKSLFLQYSNACSADIHESIPKQFLTTSDKRLRKGNRSSNTIAVPI